MPTYHSEIRAAIGDNDDNANYILSTLESAGMPTASIHRIAAPTLVNYLSESGGADMLHRKNPNSAADAHTPEDLLNSLSKKLNGTIVYVAGFTRKPGVIDPLFGWENALDALKERGAITMVDPGRLPEKGTLRHDRATSHISHFENLNRVAIWAMNEKEFYEYLGVADNDKINEYTIEELTSLTNNYVFKEANPAVFCVTLGEKGIFIRTKKAAKLVEAPGLPKGMEKTTVGLGDSTKAGMIAAFLKECSGEVQRDKLLALTDKQLGRIAAFGSAVSLNRLTTGMYGDIAAVEAIIATYLEHFAIYGIKPDYLHVA